MKHQLALIVMIVSSLTASMQAGITYFCEESDFQSSFQLEELLIGDDGPKLIIPMDLDKNTLTVASDEVNYAINGFVGEELSYTFFQYGLLDNIWWLNESYIFRNRFRKETVKTFFDKMLYAHNGKSIAYSISIVKEIIPSHSCFPY